MTLPLSLNAPPAGSQQTAAPQSPDSNPALSLPGYCLLADEQARLVAADEVATKLLGKEHIAAAQASTGSFLDHVFQDFRLLSRYRTAWDQSTLEANPEANSEASDELQAVSRHTPEKRLTISFRLLEGASDRWVLLSVRLADAPPTSTRCDSLTNLPDRDRLAWQVSQLQNQSYALLFIDLNDFKQVNDQHGHAAGDSVLQTVAANWQECVRDNDLLVRYGGDEFVLLLPGVRRLEDAQPVIDRLQQAIAQPVAHHDVQFRLSAAIGAAIGHSAKTPLKEVLAAADRAMYADKDRPR